MAHISTFTKSTDGLSVEYVPAHRNSGTDAIESAHVWLELKGAVSAYLSVSIEEARELAVRLTDTVMLHDAAVRLASELAVDGSGSGDSVGQAA